MKNNMCIFDFLLDSEQQRFRRLAQLQNERFESTIETYRDIFIVHLNKVKTNEITSDYLSKGNMDELNLIKKVIEEIDEQEILYFFDELIEIYKFWLKSNGVKSVQKFCALLKKYELFEFYKNIENKIMYRGRIKNKSLHNSFDMFHIPFDKRYLIANQRYSLAGIPLLYLGSSIYNVVSELCIPLKEYEKINFSYYYLKSDEEFLVYDLTNDFYKFFSFERKITEIPLEKKLIKSMFFKLILSSVNSFEKKTIENLKFHEEYILPQILTQVLVLDEKIKGIMYPSTKIKDIANDKNFENTYNNNIVIFTQYFPERHYDYKLYDKFIISHPINCQEICSLHMPNKETLEELINSYNERNKKLGVAVEFLNISDKIKIEDLKYIDHEIGKFELFFIYNFILINKKQCEQEEE